MHHTTAQFSHNLSTRTFTTCISDLGLQPFGQIYPDACDVGLCLYSERTGQESRWYLDNVEDNNDDVVSYTLKPTSETLRKIPRLTGYRMKVFND